jgi:hypothetical protein
MVNKKGYIKTIEAVIAIIAVLIFIFAITPDKSSKVPVTPPIIQSTQDYLTNEILTNNEIRNCVVTNPQCENAQIMEDLMNNIPPGFSSIFKICEATKDCLISTPLDQSIYFTDVFVSSTIEVQDPKIVRIWIWKS